MQAIASCPEANIVIHTDPFAAGYHLDEYTLLGMAIKYCTLRGIKICVIGGMVIQ